MVDELNIIKKENDEKHKLLNFLLIEQKKLQKVINAFKTKSKFY